MNLLTRLFGRMKNTLQNPFDDSSRVNDSGFKYDPIEDDPKFKSIIEAAEKEVEVELANEPKVMGYCHQYWETKKRILKEKYGIDWKSPSEMNPDVLFD